MCVFMVIRIYFRNMYKNFQSGIMFGCDVTRYTLVIIFVSDNNSKQFTQSAIHYPLIFVKSSIIHKICELTILLLFNCIEHFFVFVFVCVCYLNCDLHSQKLLNRTVFNRWDRKNCQYHTNNNCLDIRLLHVLGIN